MSAKSNRFTLNRENKRFLGVCAGLADYLEVPTVVIRIIALLACLTWPTLILVYFVAYWWLKQDNQDGKMHNPETPRRGYKRGRKGRADKAGYSGESDMSDMADEMAEMTQQSRSKSSKETEASIAMSMQECSEVFKRTETRLRDVEAFITSKKFRLHCEINRI